MNEDEVLDLENSDGRDGLRRIEGMMGQVMTSSEA